MQSSFETLNKVIVVTDEFYKNHDRNTSFCDARKELVNDGAYFTSIYNQDMAIEASLNRHLKTLIADAAVDGKQATAESDKLFLLCLNGHVAKLEYRRTSFTIFIAALLVTIPVWATKESPIRELFILLTILFALAFWSVMGNIDKRIFVLKRTAEHLKLLTERD